ncbi:MAG TPA: type II toxin-antitoxin system VapC family toxin [Longimicrobiales bacterium]|nr:type II toxin-antitoxin system VapC family toxin [Longimicrobiales bacterium]
MRLLLDTHVWAWSLLEPERLGAQARAALAEPENDLWLSPVSAWELALLIERGRLRVDRPAVQWVEEALSRIPLREATLNHAVALRSRTISLPHQDPADRFLAATAIVYELTLVTADRRLIDRAACAVLPSA